MVEGVVKGTYGREKLLAKYDSGISTVFLLSVIAALLYALGLLYLCEYFSLFGIMMLPIEFEFDKLLFKYGYKVISEECEFVLITLCVPSFATYFLYVYNKTLTKETGKPFVNIVSYMSCFFYILAIVLFLIVIVYDLGGKTAKKVYMQEAANNFTSYRRVKNCY